MLTFHVVGEFAANQVKCSAVDSTRRIVPEVEAMIESAWRDVLARPGVKLYDGPISRLERFQQIGDQLHLALSQTSYRIFVGTNLYHPELADQFGADVMANPVGVSTVLQTADNKLLFGVRNGAVAYYPRRTHPFAGSLEPRDNGNIFAAARRELREEIALTDADLGQLTLLGLVEDRLIRHPELIFSATTVFDERTLIAQMDEAEHHDTVAIPAERVAVESAAADSAFTPVGVACLLLWGRVQFGNRWFHHMQEGLGSRC
jgi:8-oxo-dGTP pyrophosphatase MutT (NUDIX family)